MTRFTDLDSPLGPVRLTTDGSALTGLYLNEPPALPDDARDDDAAPFPEARRQLSEYFAGRRTAFALPLAPSGTPFQRRVWEALCQIPFGETISYGELARRIGDAKASRAVGLANGRNPLSIVIPCHRVIGANGKLVGYGGGLPRKEALLAFEARVRARGPHPLTGNAAERTLF